MPNNRRLTKKTIKGKESVHPGSRKGEQAGWIFVRSRVLWGVGSLEGCVGHLLTPGQLGS
jgi:hypothetical protein